MHIRVAKSASPEHRVDTVLLRSDSQLMINPMPGIYAVKHETLKLMHHVAKMLVRGMGVYCVHVMREQNVLADEMANYGVDERVAVPGAIINLLASQGLEI